jgi:hypothetical protein
MNPTDDDLKRNGVADLAVCEAASPGPWTADMARIEDGDPGHYCGLVRGQGNRLPAHCYGGGPKRRLDCEFIALARTALPAWIRRAQAAEAEVGLLRGAIEAQDGRERAAGAACGVPYEEHGCDWPNAVAEEVARLRHIITGHEKGGALMAAGMESQCELMATMKQEMRAAQVASAYYRSLLERLTDACEVGIVATYGEVVDEVIAKAKAALADKGGDL